MPISIRFIQPMEAEPAKVLPTGSQWIYEIKFDGYRAEVLREAERVLLCSRRGHQLNRDFPDVVRALQFLTRGTVIDGGIAALDSNGRPSFTLMQNRQTEKPHIVYFAFDILIHNGVDVTKKPLLERRALLRSVIVPNDHVSIFRVQRFSSANSGICKGPAVGRHRGRRRIANTNLESVAGHGLKHAFLMTL